MKLRAIIFNIIVAIISLPILNISNASVDLSNSQNTTTQTGSQANSQNLPSVEEIHAVRKALVIGNSNYLPGGLFTALTNPQNDATALAARLRDYDFQVTPLLDAGSTNMTEAIDTFIDGLGKSDVALIYYSGHGVATTCRRGDEQHNYLVPVNKVFKNSADLCEHAISVQWVLDRLNERGGGTNLLILDACRSVLELDDAESKGVIDSKGFVEMHGSGSFIGYASAPRQPALGNKSSRYSLFTDQLLASLAPPSDSLPLEILFKQVRIAVTTTAESLGGRQTPWSDSGLIGDFCFRSPCIDLDSRVSKEQELEKENQRLRQILAKQSDDQDKQLQQELIARETASQNLATVTPKPQPMLTLSANDTTSQISPELINTKSSTPLRPVSSSNDNGLFDVEILQQIGLTPYDIKRLRDQPNILQHVLHQINIGAYVTDFDKYDQNELQTLITASPLPITDANDLAGIWRCRVTKLGGDAGLSVYGFFRCRISGSGSVASFEKLTGSQRSDGDLIRLNAKTFIFKGVTYADYQPRQNYGNGPTNDIVGLLYRLGPERLRIEFPAPYYESEYDVMELLRE